MQQRRRALGQGVSIVISFLFYAMETLGEFKSCCSQSIERQRLKADKGKSFRG